MVTKLNPSIEKNCSQYVSKEDFVNDRKIRPTTKVAKIHAAKYFFLIIFLLPSFFNKEINPVSHATIPIKFKNVEKTAIDIADKKIEWVIFSLFRRNTVKTIHKVTNSHINELKIKYPVL